LKGSDGWVIAGIVGLGLYLLSKKSAEISTTSTGNQDYNDPARSINRNVESPYAPGYDSLGNPNVSRVVGTTGFDSTAWFDQQEATLYTDPTAYLPGMAPNLQPAGPDVSGPSNLNLNQFGQIIPFAITNGVNYDGSSTRSHP